MDSAKVSMHVHMCETSDLPFSNDSHRHLHLFLCQMSTSVSITISAVQWLLVLIRLGPMPASALLGILTTVHLETAKVSSDYT